MRHLLLILLVMLPAVAFAQSQFPPFIPQNCTLATLATASCVQQIDGSVAVITDGNAADSPDMCALGGAGGGAIAVTCERIAGLWSEVIPDPVLEALVGELVCNITIEQPALTDRVMCGKATSNITMQSMNCTASGTASDVTLIVVRCDSNGTNCVTTGLELLVNLVDTNFADSSSTSDPALDDWFGLDVTALTTAPDFVHCQIEATK